VEDDRLPNPSDSKTPRSDDGSAVVIPVGLARNARHVRLGQAIVMGSIVKADNTYTIFSGHNQIILTQNDKMFARFACAPAKRKWQPPQILCVLLVKAVHLDDVISVQRRLIEHEVQSTIRTFRTRASPKETSRGDRETPCDGGNGSSYDSPAKYPIMAMCNSTNNFTS